jgi:dihydroneopterin aldolase
MNIHLEGLRFYGYHGLYVHERKLGAWFELELTLQWPDPDLVIVHLHQTVNYAAVYEVIESRMDQPTELLETLVMELGTSLKAQFPVLTAIRIRMTKLNPPLFNFQGRVAVEYSKSF